MKDTPLKELVELLNQAKSLAEANIGKADNFDLEDLSYALENYIDELNEIEEFETHDDDDDDDDDDIVIRFKRSHSSVIWRL